LKGGVLNIEGVLEEGLRLKGADVVELVAVRQREELTRFTGGRIHQNVATEGVVLYARAWVEGRFGVAETNDLSPGGLKEALRQAARIARAQGSPAGYWPPEPKPIAAVAADDEATWAATPEERAALVARAVKEPNSLGFNASGSLSTGGMEVWVLSSKGVEAHHRGSQARFITVITGRKQGSGYAEFSSTSLSDLRPEEVASRALKKAADSENRIPIEPGEYTVVLEPPAVATLLGMLSYMGFSARAVLEGRSFLCDRFGERLASELVTVYDDGLDERTLPLPFDFEGMPKKRVYFFRGGVAEGVVHDCRTAALMGAESTGHALPPPYSTYSPMPMHIVLAPGGATLEELIAGVEQGLLVTRFHYARAVDPRRAMMTMMTRDGTFLIQDGKITQAVEDLRVTESGLRALAGVEAVGRDPSLITGGEGFGGYLVPPLRIARFTFTGRTERV